MQRILAIVAAGLVLAGATGVVALGPSFSPASPPAGPCFVAEGSVEYYNFWTARNRDAIQAKFGFTPPGSNTMNFTIVVSNSCYLLRLEATKPRAAGYYEAGFDGRQLYLVTALVPPSIQDVPAGVNLATAGLNVATARIYHQQRVVYSTFAHQMGPVWLMFASGEYFRSVTNGLVEPPLTFGLFENDEYYPRPFTIPAQWTLQQAFPFLPLRVICQDDGEVKTAPPFQDTKREPPFDAGFTNIVFEVTGTREFDGNLVPCSAVLDTYRLDFLGKPGLRPYTHYHLTLKKWSKGIPPTCFIPKLPGRTAISDTRASWGGGRTVLADKWPTDGEAAEGGRK